MELAAYLKILWRRKMVVGIVTLIATIATGVAILFVPKIYTATAILRVAPSSSKAIEYAQLLYTERIINTYAELATTRIVLLELASTVGFDVDTPPKIEVEVSAETELIKISVKHRSPDTAKKTAYELANMLLNERIAKDMRVTIIEPANLEPTTPLIYVLYVFLGVMVGLGGGSGLAFLLENLDTRLYTPDQIADVAGLPVLGQVPIIEGQQSTLLRADILYKEAFRLIRASLLSLLQEEAIRTLLVTSAVPQEGKSMTTAFLALSLAQTNRTVVAVDTDLHCPRLHEIFGLPNEQGLSRLLAGQGSLSDVLQNGPCPNLQVLTSGPSLSSSLEQPYSTRMEDLLKQLVHRFDLVLLDTPPVCALADAVELASVVDGVVLVASCGRVDRESLAITCRQLNGADAEVLGVVVNHVRTTASRRYSAYY